MKLPTVSRVIFSTVIVLITLLCVHQTQAQTFKVVIAKFQDRTGTIALVSTLALGQFSPQPVLCLGLMHSEYGAGTCQELKFETTCKGLEEDGHQ